MCNMNDTSQCCDEGKRVFNAEWVKQGVRWRKRWRKKTQKRKETQKKNAFIVCERKIQAYNNGNLSHGPQKNEKEN